LKSISISPSSESSQFNPVNKGNNFVQHGMLGEYVYFVRDEVAYSKEKMKVLCEKGANAEREIRRKIEESGKKVLNGHYTDGVVLGSKP